MSKIRIDELLIERGLVRDRKEAVALLLSGIVYADGRMVDKAGTRVDEDIAVELKPRRSKYVSRGGEKLEGALEALGLNPQGWICLDLGASTGGFTHCLLTQGAARVYAFDVGKGQLDWNLRRDPRVVVREGFNVRRITPEDVPESVDLIVADLSFISLDRIFPALKAFMGTRILVLVKPQFEARPEEVEPGGVIRNEEKRREIIERTIISAQETGFRLLGRVDSPIPGPKGNREHFILLIQEPDLL